LEEGSRAFPPTYTSNADQRSKFMDKPFTVVRPDGNLTVLPRKYVPELRVLPMEKLNVIQLLCIVG
jgi:hypothetical protein